ncbi:hypothetical protein [Streptomyces poriferorum]|uniref:Uncharacterized protein n=1 Tax=Streptomyces poriferorum TaxID=2798799 RepID=A0ABY9J546_9ACTN|nr:MULTISPECIES: hypothetical protein [unclassified Streptomyces]MDP5317383.1 hypothetical protein [Streptomyces sp. Alt4]WLQ61989.1 hypothetical protein P8A19_41680 [Streptomyces sp. Alt2]
MRRGQTGSAAPRGGEGNERCLPQSTTPGCGPSIGSAHFLRWQYETLGAGPTTRLLSQLTPRICDKLRTAASPEAAAASALSIHLSHGPTGFGLITCGNTAPDGSSVHLPHTGSQYEAEETRHLRVPWKWSAHHHSPVELTALQVLHLQSDDPVPLPEHAAPLVAAHLAYRRSQGATDANPLFIHTKDPGRKSPELQLREAVIRTCHRIHFNPAWLHRSHRRHGDETAHDAAAAGWMHYRGLDLTALSDDIRSRL